MFELARGYFIGGQPPGLAGHTARWFQRRRDGCASCTASTCPRQLWSPSICGYVSGRRSPFPSRRVSSWDRRRGPCDMI